jgi:hypothetical protein
VPEELAAAEAALEVMEQLEELAARVALEFFIYITRRLNG